MPPKPRVWLEINLKAIQNNFKTIAQKVAPLNVMCVLKANAYGLGVKKISEALKEAGATCFGVAELREAQEINNNGIPVQIIGGLIPEEIPEVVREEIIAPITDLQTAQLLNLEAQKQNKITECHFLIDTGMGRLGVLQQPIQTILQSNNLPNLNCTGIYSHFPHAYGDPEFSRYQIKIFIELLEKLRAQDITFKHIHIANSDGINNIPESYQSPFNMVRTGINLYGIFDTKGLQTYKL